MIERLGSPHPHDGESARTNGGAGSFQKPQDVAILSLFGRSSRRPGPQVDRFRSGTMQANQHHKTDPVQAVTRVMTEHPVDTGDDGSLTETEAFILEMLERLDEANTEAANLQRALEHSRDIGAAVGVVMAFHKMPQDEAFEMLRRTSQDLNRKLYALAREVLATGELPSRL
ncbi:ANTAR domain-containing response regulator [Humibacillus xanthopallidus]|uniref:ANTAR domain-containing response regulator n=1 Tax=Humibacillus xanthopallidus TaxID=412689 RepID=UPI00384D8DC9